MRRTKPSARTRILSDDELQAVWSACSEINGSFGAMIKLLLLTAQRREKVAAMRWNDLRDGVWAIPEQERQKGTAGKLALPKLVLDIIEAQPRIHGNSFVVAARGKGPFNSFSQRKVELDRKLPGDMPPWTLHDLRCTARSLMSRAGIRPDIAERVLGHAIPGVEGVYDRHRYDAEKENALEQLAHLVETIVTRPTSNVITISERR